ncbi:MAG: acetylglutamate kinase [Rhodobacterales bacterium]|nr:acetylglutamate kinase [Rhodobacterales bacterium]|tara:strand:+ start:253 stop:1107 length:855 start_codon:yes stop_codon:yes gene_type:complete
MNTKEGFLNTAKTLAEALPFLQRYDGAIIVIKLGGHAMTDLTAMKSFARDIVLMKQCNVNPIIIHGGGPMINATLAKLNITSSFHEGKRITTEEIMEVVEMVLSGKVNKSIVSALNEQGGKAVGLSGKDSSLIYCEQDTPELGCVGKIMEINPEVLNSFIDSDFIPVVAPIGYGNNSKTYNINGDTVAGALASSLSADRLLLLTDVEGVKSSEGNLIPQLDPMRARKLIKDGVISEGMIPKVNTSLDAIENGVRASVIIDGRVEHSCLLELFTSHGAGTLFRNS